MSTYIVEVDSTYRDVNKYVNNCDFATSFQQNSTTDYQVQGLPISPSGYFINASIDPDFNNTNFRVVGGTVIDIQRDNTSLFVTGLITPFKGTGFAMYYGSTILFAITGSFTEISRTGASPYLSHLNIELDASYSFEWIAYGAGIVSTSGPLGPYTLPVSSTTSICKLTDQGGVYWSFDFNYDAVNVYTYNTISKKLLYSITGSFPYQENNNLVLLPLDYLSDPYLVENKPFGYQLLNSTFNLGGNKSNALFDLQLDSAQNAYISGNVSPFIPSFSITFPSPSGSAFTSFPTFFYYTGSYTYSLNYTSNVTFALVTNDSYVVAMVSTGTTSIYDFTGVFSVPVNSLPNWYSLTGTPARYIRYEQTIQFGDKVYILFSPTPTPSANAANLNLTVPIQIYQVDIPTSTFTFCADTPALRFNTVVFSAYVYNNYFYIGVREQISGDFYVYRFDPATNIVTQEGASLATSNVQTRGFCYNSWMIGSYIYYNVMSRGTNIVIPDGYQTIVQFDPATNNKTIVYTNSAAVWYVLMTQTFEIQSQTLIASCYLAYGKALVYNVTNPSNPSLVYSYNEATSNPTLIVATGTNNGVTNTYIAIGNLLANTYNILNVITPSNIFKLEGSFGDNRGGLIAQNGGSAILGIDKYGYAYGAQFTTASIPTQTPLYKSNTFLASQEIYSSHYNYNPSSNTDLFAYASSGSTGYYQNQFITFPNNTLYNIVANYNQIDLYTISDLVVNNYQQSLYYPVANTGLPNSISIGLNNTGSYCYLSVSFSDILYLYSCDTSSTSWSLISQITGANFSPTNNTISSGLIYTTTYAINPDTFMHVTDRNGYSRKYALRSTGAVYITGAQPFLSTAVVGSTALTYYDSLGIYTIRTAAFNPLTYNVVFDVTNYNDFTSVQAPRFRPSTLYNYLDTYKVGSNYLFFNLTDLTNYLYTFSANQSITGPNVQQNLIFYPIISPLYPSSPFANWTDGFTSRVYNVAKGIDTGSQVAITDITDPTYPVIVSNLIIPNSTGTIFSIRAYSQNGRSALSFLIDNRYQFLYDVTNIQNAIQYTVPKLVTTTYTNLQQYGGSFVHKILYNGTPNWLNSAGSQLDSNIGSYNYLCSMTTDENSNLYVSGSWTNRLQLFQTYNSTGNSSSLTTWPVNQITNTNRATYQAFIAKIRPDTGEWIWAEPLIGTNNTFIGQLKYTSQNNQLPFALYFNSSNVSLYNPQLSVFSTGPRNWGSLGTEQVFLTNVNFFSSALLTIDTDGVYQWNAKLFDDTVEISVLATIISTDTGRISVGGTSNSLHLECIDSSNVRQQTLYSKATDLSTYYIFQYDFSFTGSYLQSNYTLFPPNTLPVLSNIKSYPDLNQVLRLNNVFLNPIPSTIFSFNKDGTLAQQYQLTLNSYIGVVSNYDYNSIYTDPNRFDYSRVYLYGFSGPAPGSLQNYQLFILGQPLDPIVNQNFVIRDNGYDPLRGQMYVTLNQVIDTSQINRFYSTTNGIPLSQYYRSVNISQSPLVGIGYYNNVSQTGNSIVLDDIFGNIPIDTSKEYYFVFPQQTGTNGIYNDIVPITSITQDPVSLLYTASVNNINDLRVPSPSGPLYGPHIYLSIKNYSAFYTLQWYPGSRVYPQTYLVGLYDLIIPNRPIRNSRYPGLQTISKYPYIYLVIYNSDENNNFDPSVVNSVYDNNVDVPRFALFQIPTTTFAPASSTNDYISATSTATPKILFVPEYYNLRFKLTDDRGNVLFFDNTPYKDGDSIFEGSVIPDSLLNITIRLAFKKV
jgi:hypothetical protein